MATKYKLPEGHNDTLESFPRRESPRGMRLNFDGDEWLPYPTKWDYVLLISGLIGSLLGVVAIICKLFGVF